MAKAEACAVAVWPPKRLVGVLMIVFEAGKWARERAAGPAGCCLTRRADSAQLFAKPNQGHSPPLRCRRALLSRFPPLQRLLKQPAQPREECKQC